MYMILFKKIKDFDNYLINLKGQIWSDKHNKFLKVQVNN